MSICIKVKELRKIGYLSLEDWMNHDNNIYVGRGGRIWITENGETRIFHYKDSKWKNPFRIEKGCNAEESMRLYHDHLTITGLINDIGELKDKKLGCFCEIKKDKCGNPLCHAELLFQLNH